MNGRRSVMAPASNGEDNAAGDGIAEQGDEIVEAYTSWMASVVPSAREWRGAIEAPVIRCPNPPPLIV
jgi:hypothetical protein